MALSLSCSSKWIWVTLKSSLVILPDWRSFAPAHPRWNSSGTRRKKLPFSSQSSSQLSLVHSPFFKHRSDWNDKKVRQLQTNSNILIASLAAAGLLVGAVCMPLTISLDTLILRGIASENIICTRVLVAMVVLYTAWSVSFYHLVIISWERYLAIVKRVEYKIIITKSRVNLLLLFQIPTL